MKSQTHLDLFNRMKKKRIYARKDALTLLTIANTHRTVQGEKKIKEKKKGKFAMFFFDDKRREGALQSCERYGASIVRAEMRRKEGKGKEKTGEN